MSKMKKMKKKKIQLQVILIEEENQVIKAIKVSQLNKNTNRIIFIE